MRRLVSFRWHATKVIGIGAALLATLAIVPTSGAMVPAGFRDEPVATLAAPTAIAFA